MNQLEQMTKYKQVLFDQQNQILKHHLPFIDMENTISIDYKWLIILILIVLLVLK